MHLDFDTEMGTQRSLYLSLNFDVCDSSAGCVFAAKALGSTRYPVLGKRCWKCRGITE
jgi:hypothetical protein